MKFSLIFFLCLTIFYVPLTVCPNVILDPKGDQDQLSNQTNLDIVRKDQNGQARKQLTPSDFLYSVVPDDSETVTNGLVEDYELTSRPITSETKQEDKAVYTFEKEVESEDLDEKVAKKFRDKARVLKQNKHKQYKSPNQHYRHRKKRKEPKEQEDLTERVKPHTKLLKDSNEELDPSFSIPQGTGQGQIAKELYVIDPILNMLRTNVETRRRKDKTSRHKNKTSMHKDKISRQEDSDSGLSLFSSSLEIRNFKEQFRDLWLQKKYDALNATPPSGDQINMGRARPWGIKCGDPNQLDMPWGTCMLAMECDAEYRIAKGDMYCGRTSFVCCALELTTYDMYEGFDVSFEGKSLSTDTEELRLPEQKRKKYLVNLKKRRQARERRKKKIKKTIMSIILEINKILSTFYTNSTNKKKKKTKQLKRFIKFLKREYQKNRFVAKDLHEEAMVKIDTDLMKKLYDIKSMNLNFMKNQTFADIVVNGTMTKVGARMLIQAYPELQEFIDRPAASTPGRLSLVPLLDVKTRRSGGAVVNSKEKRELKPQGDYLQYDVEYGFLYY